jgi:hypothetical protein
MCRIFLHQTREESSALTGSGQDPEQATAEEVDMASDSRPPNEPEPDEGVLGSEPGGTDELGPEAGGTDVLGPEDGGTDVLGREEGGTDELGPEEGGTDSFGPPGR